MVKGAEEEEEWEEFRVGTVDVVVGFIRGNRVEGYIHAGLAE